MRDYNKEFQESDSRQYAYQFDYLMHDFFLEVFSPQFNGGDALELGCFEGEFTAKLLPYFSSLTVIEASSELVAKAAVRASHTPEFILSTFELADLGDRKFDAIFLMHVMEHLDDPGLVLKRIRKWLRVGGKLYIAVPNANAMSRQIAVKMGVIDYCIAVSDGERAHGHRRTYSLDYFEHELSSNGFHIQQSGGVFFKPFANFQFDRMLESKAIDMNYINACFELGKKYPDFCASLFAICQ